MNKINIFLSIYLIQFFSLVSASEVTFNDWLSSFKKLSLNEGISENTFNLSMKNARFLPNVIKYDRYQPEFYEDTIKYMSKRSNNKKVKKGIKLYTKNKKFINSIENKYNIEKELLLALMGIETNFGTYVGKMDIISSLATLSFDKRRSDFFTNELITLLKLIDQGVLDHNILFGSWAGAFGNFQFMPSTIKNHAVDYNLDNKIELKKIEDSFASAANYLNKIGWKKNEPCYIKIELKPNTPSVLLNTSAKKIDHKIKFKDLKKYIDDFDSHMIDAGLYGAIITPDKDIIPDAKNLKPAYFVFNNYELILKWNRSLRFALAVCQLKNKFKNEL